MLEVERTIPQLPVENPIRVAVDRSLEVFTQLDYTMDYRMNRGVYEYVDRCHGLRAYFDYLKTLDRSNMVIDVGAGTTRAAYQLSTDPMTFGLDIWAAILKRQQAILYHHPSDKILETSVEYLEGVEDESVAGILAVASIGYSVAPEHAMRRVNEVLVAGGVLKATFNHRNVNALRFQRHDRFSHELRQLGYDVHIEDFGDLWDVMVALKPGYDLSCRAKDLLLKDAQTTEEQKKNTKHYLTKNADFAWP